MDPAPPAGAALDAEEYLHLALRALNDDRRDESLRFAKSAVALDPENGNACYLLGALHAEIGMIPRAISEIGRALELAPQLATARFQLGMLHLSQGEEAQAHAVWQPLEDLDAIHPLRRFRDGMLLFLQERHEEAVAMLEDGIARNETSPRLNAQMELVVAQARAVAESAGGAPEGVPAPSVGGAPPQSAGTKPAPDRSPAPQHVLLAGYRKQQDPR